MNSSNWLAELSYRIISQFPWLQTVPIHKHLPVCVLQQETGSHFNVRTTWLVFPKMLWLCLCLALSLRFIFFANKAASDNHPKIIWQSSDNHPKIIWQSSGNHPILCYLFIHVQQMASGAIKSRKGLLVWERRVSYAWHWNRKGSHIPELPFRCDRQSDPIFLLKLLPGPRPPTNSYSSAVNRLSPANRHSQREQTVRPNYVLK